jgi:hypothetical protein
MTRFLIATGIALYTAGLYLSCRGSGYGIAVSGAGVVILGGALFIGCAE